MSEQRHDGVAISVRGVTKRYGDMVALDRIDLEIEQGEFVVLGGPSGSGKSTLLHLLAALERPDGGTIEVQGRRLDHHSRHLDRFRRIDVGIVFQLHNLIPRLTARENIEAAMFGTHHGRRERVARASELLARLALEHRAEDRPPTMSGGERQRVAIARALANHPRVILADEPTGSLDDVSAALVLDLFDELRGTGTTVLAVSHDARLDRRADRMVDVVEGRTSLFG